MEKLAIKDVVYGGLEEIVTNDRYYYYSPVGPNYCHLTEDGKDAIIEYLNFMAWKIREAEDEELNRRAKDQVIKSLKQNT